MNLYTILLSVASMWGLAVVTPGPNFFITARTTARHSSFAGFFIVLGTCTGTMVWAMAGYFGITSLFRMAPWLYMTLKALGGCYILYLGIMMIVHSWSSSSTDQKVTSRMSSSCYRNWLNGLITNLSNPKTAMFVTSLFATVLPRQSTLGMGIGVMAVMVLISFVWYSFVVLIFSSNRFRTGYHRMQKWIEGLAGVIFIGFGSRLIFDDQ